MRKLFTLMLLATFILLSGCSLLGLKQERNYDEKSFTLDAYYNDIPKIVYAMDDSGIYLFEDITKEGTKLDLSQLLRDNERMHFIPTVNGINDIYDINLFYTDSDNSIFGSELLLRYTINGRVAFVVYDELLNSTGVIACNLIENDCKRLELNPIKGVQYRVYNTINTETFYFEIRYQGNYQLYFVDQDLNFIELHKNSKYAVVSDYDHFDGDSILVLAPNDTGTEIIKFDLSDYNFKKTDHGIQQVKQPYEYEFIFSTFVYSDNMNKILNFDYDKSLLTSYDKNLNQIEQIHLNESSFVNYINEQYILVKGSNGNYQLYDMENDNSYDLKIRGKHIQLTNYYSQQLFNPRLVDNKLFYSETPKLDQDLKFTNLQSYYFDLETKTVHESVPLTINNLGHYYTNNALVFSKPCQLYIGKIECSSDNISVYHKEYGVIENIPYVDQIPRNYFIDEHQIFYKNTEGKLAAYQFSSQTETIIGDVNQYYDVYKYDKDTYIITLDKIVYQYENGHLTKLDYINQLKS